MNTNRNDWKEAFLKVESTKEKLISKDLCQTVSPKVNSVVLKLYILKITHTPNLK